VAALNRWTVIRYSGKADNIKDGSSYWNVLDEVHTELQGAGSSWDAPKMLMHNGVIVISEKLADISYTYCVAKRDALEKAANETRSRFEPEWLDAIERAAGVRK